MESIEEVGEAPRSGCLKWTCLGCLSLIMLFSITGVIVWYALKSWNKGESAWEHMPPSTYFALEVHDIDGLIRHGLKDAGVLSLLRYGSASIAELAAELSGESRGSFRNAFDDLAETYDSYGFLYTAIAPNMILFGAVSAEAGDEDDIFMIFKPPTWLRWSMTLPSDDGTIEINTQSGSTTTYMFYKNGWIAVATTRALAQEIMDNWDARTLPLGVLSATAEPRLIMALRLEESESSESTAETTTEAPLMFNNPFAPPPDSDSDVQETVGEGSRASQAYCRLALVPSNGDWDIQFEFAEQDQPFSNGLSTAVDTAFPSKPVLIEPVNGSEFGLLCKISPNLLGRARKAVLKKADDIASDADPAWLSAAKLTAYDAWLAKVSGSFAFYAAKPAAKTVDGVAPLPVLSLGWTIDPTINGALAANDFTNSMTTLLESLKSPGGPPLRQALRDGIAYTTEKGGRGMGGTVTLPPVAVNSAKPVWLFPAGVTPGQGWMASDPAGLPDKGIAASQWNALAVPDDEHINAAAAWLFTSEFQEGLREVILERRNLLGDDASLEHALSVAEKIIASFPRGWCEIKMDEGTQRRVMLKVTIAGGVNAFY